MSESKILLGFEVGTGEPVYMPLHHLAIFGMTQLSGKTTTLEALISRSGLRAIAFITKRGEAGFTTYNLVTPYYKARADWQFVEGLVNVALGERVKFEPGMRYGIMRVCRGRKDLKEIQKAAVDLARETKREFMKAVYEKLVAYLEIVIPELEKWVFTDKLELSEGVNVMDISGMRLETQHLVIASTIEYAFAHLDHVIVIIPEAWESIPQGKMTPVKWVAQQFIRKGAAIGNYMFLDSQDIGGIDKTPLRQCDNWLMGRMKEAHEVERILKQLLGIKVPAEEIQTLPLGHFYAAIGNEVKKIYVLPMSVPEEVGRKVALGELSPEYVKDNFLKKVKESDDELVWKEKYRELEVECEKQRESFETWKKMLEEDMEKRVQEASKKAMETVEEFRKTTNVEEYRETIAKLKDELNGMSTRQDELEKKLVKLEGADRVLTRLREALAPIIADILPSPKEGEMVAVDLEHRELDVTIRHAEKQVNMTTDTVVGKILFCAINNLPKEGFSESELSSALQEFGWNIGHSTLAPTLANLAKDGYLVKLDTRPTKYRLPLKLKINVAK